MAKASNRRGKEEKKKEKKKRAKFFKVFLKQLSSRQLRIPPAFIHNFNGTVPNKAILKHSSGRCSHVELEELKSGLFINSGWQSFVNDHCIEHGDFLIFKYDGDSLFKVTIFGPSGCTKEDIRVTEPTTFVKVKEERKTEEESCRRPNRSQKPRVSKSCPRFAISGQLEGIYSKKYAKIREKACRLFESKGLELPKNPHFLGTRTMPSTPYIPKSVVHKHQITLEEEVVIRRQNGKSWPVRLAFKNDGPSRIAFTTGWSTFVKDNDLERGDNCVFEFILSKERICKELRVRLFPRQTRRAASVQ